MKTNCLILVAIMSVAAADAFGQDDKSLPFLKELRAEAAAINQCYRANAIRFATQTCEPASTVVDAAYGACRHLEKAYADAVRKLGGPSFSDEPERALSETKEDLRPAYLVGVLNTRLKAGICQENSN
jgi:hypothetical protein